MTAAAAPSGLTVAAALRRVTRELVLAGVPDAAGDARRLTAHALQIDPGRLTLALPEPLPMPAAARLDAALSARVMRRPVAQITGQRLFWGRPFRVTADTLDPRPETEVLIAAALEARFGSVLDLGTGTGAILLTLLAERPAARGTGVDLSPAALAVAQGNAAALGLLERSKWMESEWFASVSGQFDLIVSNPPYIAAAEMAALAPEVRDWEPAMALTDGGDGLGAYRAISAGVGRHLAPGGRLLVEIGPTQGAAVVELLRRAGLVDLRVIPDLDGRDRVVSGLVPAI